MKTGNKCAGCTNFISPVTRTFFNSKLESFEPSLDYKSDVVVRNVLSNKIILIICYYAVSMVVFFDVTLSLFIT